MAGRAEERGRDADRCLLGGNVADYHRTCADPGAIPDSKIA